MADPTSIQPATNSSLRLWIAGIVYLVFGAPLVFVVSSRVLSAPILVIMLLGPPQWFKDYVSPVFGGVVVILSLAAVYYGWRLLAAQLRHAA